MTDPAIRLLAGATAFDRIRDGGLSQNDIALVAGAAGGPKWLILKAMDQALAGLFFSGREQPLQLLGASSGAWRFSAWTQPNAVATLDDLCEAYTTQVYATRPRPDEVTAQAKRILKAFLPPDAGNLALSQAWVRLAVITARTRNLLAARQRWVQILGLATTAAANALHRRLLNLFIERVLMVDPRADLPLINPDGLATRIAPLSEENFHAAILASGSIPLVMTPITTIPGAPNGPYMDGGAVDYHPALPYRLPENKMALMPHYTDRLIPGWLDKGLSWRRPPAAHTDRLLVVTPSRHFVAALPGARIPDRTDFETFFGNDFERIRRWRIATDAGQQLADAFMNAVESGRIREMVEPL